MRLSQVQPETEEVRVVLEAGFALCQLGRLSEAEAIFRGVAELLPSSEVPQVALGQVYLQQGLWAEAQAACQEALQRARASSYARVHYAEALLHQQQYTAATELLGEVIATDPDSPHCHTAQALLAVLSDPA